MINKKKFKNITNFVLDFLFPKYCVGCDKEGSWLCNKCANDIVKIKTPTCPTCQKITLYGQFCPKCRAKTNLTGVIVAAYYEEGPLKEAIHTFKYDSVIDLAGDLGKLLNNAIDQLPDKWALKIVTVIPVPLHKKRQAKRGYNQAELLARQINIKNERLKTKNGLILTQKLIRHKYQKKSQTELSGSARRKNLVNCFSWVGDKNELKGKIVFLVDDVYTTGSTLNECAKVLRRDAGVKEVWGLVLAKA